LGFEGTSQRTKRGDSKVGRFGGHLVIEDLNLESEILLEILDYHHQERELDAERALRIFQKMGFKGGKERTG
jgi:hypothetical protein